MADLFWFYATVGQSVTNGRMPRGSNIKCSMLRGLLRAEGKRHYCESDRGINPSGGVPRRPSHEPDRHSTWAVFTARRTGESTARH